LARAAAVGGGAADHAKDASQALADRTTISAVVTFG
jgi:hypothetical protein